MQIVYLFQGLEQLDASFNKVTTLDGIKVYIHIST